MKRFSFILALLLVSFFFEIRTATALVYSPPDSCLKMIWPNDYDILTHNGSANPDSVMVDSCIGSPTYLEKYAKASFGVTFKTQYYPFNSILFDSCKFTLEDIRPLYVDLKNLLKEISNKWGTFYFMSLRYGDSSAYINDTNFPNKHNFYLRFNKEQCIDSITSNLSDTASIFSVFDYENRAKQLVYVEDKSGNEGIKLSPNPVKDYINISNFSELKSNNYKIYNAIGEMVLNGEILNSVYVGQLNQGVYFLEIGTNTYKFVKY